MRHGPRRQTGLRRVPADFGATRSGPAREPPRQGDRDGSGGRVAGVGDVLRRRPEPNHHYRALGASRMARPLDPPGPVSLLEDAAHLLRTASLDTLLCHWIGSAPLALFLLFFWNDATHPPLSDLAIAAESLGAALLLIWMNCWRSVFAGRLHASLSGVPQPRRGGREIWRLVASQAALAATKPLVLP